MFHLIAKQGPNTPPLAASSHPGHRSGIQKNLVLDSGLRRNDDRYPWLVTGWFIVSCQSCQNIEVFMFENEFEIACMAARGAGSVLKEHFGKPHQIVKKGVIDLVTEADLAAEKTILKLLQDHFPEDNILSEEAGERDMASDRVWIVDPLDGTTNFAHGFPFFAVSIGLEVAKEIVLGVVYNPYMEELFTARLGKGALLNGRQIHVSNASSLGESLTVTGFPYDIRSRSNRIFERFQRMVVSCQGVRRAGSAAIDLCYVAAGKFDGLWEENLKPWDTAAGAIMVKEAGGTLSNFEGEPFNPYVESVVAGNTLIHGEIVGTLQISKLTS
jgi:myo-inositol-1(or 4)-monophosphatase